MCGALTISEDDIFVINFALICCVNTKVVAGVSGGISGKVQGAIVAPEARNVYGRSKCVPFDAEGPPHMRASAGTSTTEGFDGLTVPCRKRVLFTWKGGEGR